MTADAEPIGLWLCSVCAAELARALSLLEDPATDRDVMVHETRKAVRRVRAWLRLCDEDTRQQLAPFDAELKALRQMLGPLRDAESKLIAVDHLLVDPGSRAHRVGLRRWRRELVAARDRRWLRMPPGGRALTRLAKGLRLAIEHVKALPLEALSEDDLHRAWRESFRRACRGARRCRGELDAERRHAWRGKLRVFLLQAQLLQERSPHAAVDQLKALTERLGLEHDHALLAQAAIRARSFEREARASLRQYLEEHRLALIEKNDRKARKLLRKSAAP